VRTTLAWTLTAAVAAASTTVLAHPEPIRAATDEVQAPTSANMVDEINFWRNRTWYWQRLTGATRWPTRYLERRTNDLELHEDLLRLWKQRAARAKARAFDPPHHQSWLCIHRYEGAWNSATGNGFYGGLQMDITFQRHYGGWLLRKKGPAHRWTPLEQIWVAERGRRVQGWYAWPNASRNCGLI
jgi:transglycosylase-like protein